MTEEQTVWDRFAAAALAGLIADKQLANAAEAPADLAKKAATVADAMVAERKSRKKPRQPMAVHTGS